MLHETNQIKRKERKIKKKIGSERKREKKLAKIGDLQQYKTIFTRDLHQLNEHKRFWRELDRMDQRKFIDWKKTKLFRFRWNWVEEKKLLGIRLQISSFTPKEGVVIL